MCYHQNNWWVWGGWPMGLLRTELKPRSFCSRERGASSPTCQRPLNALDRLTKVSRPSLCFTTRNQNVSSFPPEALVELLRRLYIRSQKVRAQMEPSVARSTNTQSAGLSGVSAWTWGGWVGLSWTFATKNPSEGQRPMNHFQNTCAKCFNSRKVLTLLITGEKHIVFEVKQ